MNSLEQHWHAATGHAVSAGGLLRVTRERAGVSLTELSEATGMDRPMLSRIENGRATPRGHEIPVLAGWVLQHAQSHEQYSSGPDYRTEPAARMTDPVQSHQTVKSIDADGALKDQILNAADHLGLFTDTMLRAWIEANTSRTRVERGTIARARGRLVRDGLLVELVERAPVNERGRQLKLFTQAT